MLSTSWMVRTTLCPTNPSSIDIRVARIEMLPSLDNFVSFGVDVFKARQDYRQMALDIYTTAITSEQLGENDAVNGCKLAESLLLNLRGFIDEVCVSVPIMHKLRDQRCYVLGSPSHYQHRLNHLG